LLLHVGEGAADSDTLPAALRLALAQPLSLRVALGEPLLLAAALPLGDAPPLRDALGEGESSATLGVALPLGAPATLGQAV
jgi:hypothetical protein